jgi:hypothetical protein
VCNFLKGARSGHNFIKVCRRIADHSRTEIQEMELLMERVLTLRKATAKESW